MDVKVKKNFLPEELILKSLVGEPERLKVPIHGGLDSVWAKILHFELKSDQRASVSLSFDDDISSLGDISFGLDGLDKVLPEDFIGEFIERSNQDELSILIQANSILNGRHEYKKYYKVIEERICHIRKHNMNNLSN
ncbi:hypothetical protein [Bacillus sp. 1P02SD]|uniref:hypothetical protein n=1 Tax=Bacillus sp. 1P02SD TaxID=3132264 RepID=UPI0039A0405D